MHANNKKLNGRRWIGVVVLLMALAHPGRGTAQSSGSEKPIVLDSYVKMHKMDVYRALAELAFRAYQRGDVDTAKTLCEILNASWNNMERITANGVGQGRLEKQNRDLCMKIDGAMDAFVEPLTTSEKPDLRVVEKSYSNYLELLKLAD
jgi:hypothetical protein